MPTTVEPAEFKFVHFDAGEISALCDELAAKVGLDADITLEIDEESANARCELVSIDPIRITAQSGAFESQKALRQFSREAAVDVLGRYLLRAVDRRAGFADAPDHDELTTPQKTAWDVYVVGRLARMGYPVQRQRWLYAFRNRHGFTDASDEAFEQLWNAEELTWKEMSSLSEEVAAQNPGALER